MPFSAHASACAILAFADGGSRNSSLHPPQEALGISTLAQGSREVRSVRLATDRGSRGGSRRRAQISLGAQIVLKADAQAVFLMLTVLMPYSQNKKSRPSVNRKTGNKFSRYHFRWQTAQSLSYRVTAANPSAFTYAGFSALSCRRSGMSSRLCPAALHQTAALCKKGALRYCFPSKRFSMCTDIILTTFHCACQAQSLKKPIIFHRN